MPQVTVLWNNETNIYTVPNGTRLIDLFLQNKIDSGGTCGGKGICNKCLVRIAGTKNDILACHYAVTSDVIIEVNYESANFFSDYHQDRHEHKVTDEFGIAIDLGTTTVAMYLYNLNSSLMIGSFSFLNPQVIYGADVISRIDKCISGFLHEEQKIITQAINKQIDQWLIEFSITKIQKIVIAGNPTMLHIIYDVNPESIGSAPYTPVFLETKTFDGADYGLHSERVVLLPSISAFIGSDLSVGILSSGMLEENTSILIDMGTNGEIILKKHNDFFGCSTATGPAFEGANIEKGVGGINGAIAKVAYIAGELVTETIGNKTPIGMCGSGLVDLVAILVSEGIIDDTGAFNHDANSQLIRQLVADRFYLKNDIYLSQKDIRQFQLAKSAICAGIETLMNAAKVNLEEVNKVFVAGGFGFHLNLENAFKIGLLPKAFNGRVVSAGNTAGLGAVMCLINDNMLNKAQEIALCVQTVDLMNKKLGFTERFIDNMLFELQ
ncbi:MAG: ASKHA domain-containing protein [Candidatus Izemoplasmatales bacterium]